jgi:hypothetical protein
MRARALVVALTLPALSVALSACGGASDDEATPPPSAPPPATPKKDRGPERVTVDHILVGVKGGGAENARRDPEQAKAVAYDLLERLRAGADWDLAKRDYSDDPTGVAEPGRPPPGGPYPLANEGVKPVPGEVARKGMVKGFGDVAFSLKVGEIGIADHGPGSPYGYHVIKRIR